jgi:hypothetical protein
MTSCQLNAPTTSSRDTNPVTRFVRPWEGLSCSLDVQFISLHRTNHRWSTHQPDTVLTELLRLMVSQTIFEYVYSPSVQGNPDDTSTFSSLPAILRTTRFNIQELYMMTTLPLRVLYGSQKKQQPFPYTTLRERTSLVVYWSAFLITNHEVPGSIPGSTMGIFP